MTTVFTHLRVASGYSLRYGVASPADLVSGAAALGMDALALTDRDGLYGAVRFAKACLHHGVSPIVGVDSATTPVDDRQGRPNGVGAGSECRVVVLAQPGGGWASLCRLVTAMHLAGCRGQPHLTPELLAEHSRNLVLVLGADSEVGRALARGDDQGALRAWRRWSQACPAGQVVAAASHHHAASGLRTASHAARTVAWADAHEVPVILTHDVRTLTPGQVRTADVLEAVRRGVPLSEKLLAGRTTAGHLADSGTMARLGDEVSRRAGRHSGVRLWQDTSLLAQRLRLDPVVDIGVGGVHVPRYPVAAGTTADQVLRQRCEAGVARRYGVAGDAVTDRLDAELDVVRGLGFASYFLTVADVVDDARAAGIRCAARGSGAGSLINYLLGIAGADPLRYGLIMERFLSPLRSSLPDIDIDVESARRTEVYDLIVRRYGGDRVACVAMMETYRLRHAIRDVGAALCLPPGEIDAMAKAFPHLRARDMGRALRELPIVQRSGWQPEARFVELVESLDGLPRHIALHPCGVIIGDTDLHQRTPVEASGAGYPMSQFDKDDVEDLGFLKLDVLGIRMQSAMAHALAEISRTEGVNVDIDALEPFDDPATYELIRRSDTIGCFQIESPGQRELLGTFGPRDFADIVIDISLFRPGPVRGDMVRPFLNARQGWSTPRYPHRDVRPVLAETGGVVVFHEQVCRCIAVMTGCSLARADEIRRQLSTKDDELDQVRRWFVAESIGNGYTEAEAEPVWQSLASFGSFGFCKAHAVAFALPTYQSAWLKTHYPAHFLAGVLTHDPGMYPKRLLLHEVRRHDCDVLGLDVNRSDESYRVELAGGRYGVRLALAEVNGITPVDIERILAGRPYQSLTDFWQRTECTVTEGLARAGAFDGLYGAGQPGSDVTRRDIVLAAGELRHSPHRGGRARGLGRQRARLAAGEDVAARVRQQVATASRSAGEAQLPLTWMDQILTPGDVRPSGLPAMTVAECRRAELEVTGLDVSEHVLAGDVPLLQALGVTFADEILRRRSRSEVLIAGVKVATQTPPLRSGRPVIFVTVDDGTGAVDATFFADTHASCGPVIAQSWQLIIRGELRRTGLQGVSVRAGACWDLAQVRAWWQELCAAEPAGAARTAARAAYVIRKFLHTTPLDNIGLPGGRRHAPDVAPRTMWYASPGSVG